MAGSSWRFPPGSSNRLRALWRRSAAVLEALESRPAFLESIARALASINGRSWRSRYELEPLRQPADVVQAIPA